MVAGNAAIVHANIKPIALQLNQASLGAYARLTTCPKDHPLQPAIERTAKCPVRRHRTALQALATGSSINPLKMEMV